MVRLIPSSVLIQYAGGCSSYHISHCFLKDDRGFSNGVQLLSSSTVSKPSVSFLGINSFISLVAERGGGGGGRGGGLSVNVWKLNLISLVGLMLVSYWCFETSQPRRVISGVL